MTRCMVDSIFSSYDDPECPMHTHLLMDKGAAGDVYKRSSKFQRSNFCYIFFILVVSDIKSRKRTSRKFVPKDVHKYDVL
jgi:hypothetical protein